MMTHPRRTGRALALIATGVATALTLAACAGGGGEDADGGEGDGTFTILQYENPESAQGQGWQKALEIVATNLNAEGRCSPSKIVSNVG